MVSQLQGRWRALDASQASLREQYMSGFSRLLVDNENKFVRRTVSASVISSKPTLLAVVNETQAGFPSKKVDRAALGVRSPWSR